MADESYDVEARIDVKDGKSRQTVGGLARQMLGVQKATLNATSGIQGLLRSTLGFAGAYLGVRTLTSGFSALAATSFEYASTLQKQQTSLNAILAATQPMFAGITDGAQRMAAAGAIGGAIFRTLQGDALKSVATSQELFGIYTMIAGPLAGAGASLTKIRDITNDTVNAASVLGVDFGQAARDINLMATGVAGQDTMLFRMLRSTKAIAETTEEWNAMAKGDPAKAVEKIGAAIEKFRAAGGAFEKTLPGVTSSFVDFMQRFRGAFMEGPLDSVRKSLIRFVSMFQGYQDEIISLLTTAGNMIGKYLDPMLDGMANATEYFLNNWELIAKRIETTWKNMLSWGKFAAEKASMAAPAGKALAAGYLVNKVGSAAVGGSLAGSAASGVSSQLATALVPLGEIIKDIWTIGAGFELIFLPVMAIAGAVGVMAENWGAVMQFAAPIGMFIQDIFVTLWGLLSSVMGVVWQLAKIIGGILLIAFTLVIGIVVAFARLFWPLIKFIFKGWSLIFDYLGQGLAWVAEWISKTFAGIAKFFGGVLDIGYGVNTGKKEGEEKGGGWLDNFMSAFDKVFDDQKSKREGDSGLIADAEATNSKMAKKTVVNDFRGSKIEVKQDFRDADPDRVWVQMVDGLSRQAESRVASRLAPEFTR